jgi:hypothetical protein
MPSLEVLASSQELAARAAILTVDALIETIKNRRRSFIRPCRRLLATKSL